MKRTYLTEKEWKIYWNPKNYNKKKIKKGIITNQPIRELNSEEWKNYWK